MCQWNQVKEDTERQDCLWETCYAVAMERLLNQYHMQADNTTVYAASLSQSRASGICRLLMTTNKSIFSVSLSPIYRTTCVETVP